MIRGHVNCSDIDSFVNGNAKDGVRDRGVVRALESEESGTDLLLKCDVVDHQLVLFFKVRHPLAVLSQGAAHLLIF